ncbi:VanZ family protein (plasmid) [Pseudorhodobacter turbinis]|uniref:VanZ family protein n=1 Tax=Pseudorhodobacter turbinis TaxID=2500533 RepID=A0A4V1E1H3_9RHOB|nr:VanZ family protein [Pseudorhodobacter turbinis]QCO58134.1 VanZ family protein [Pseudorhodobacter turbinis]
MRLSVFEFAGLALVYGTSAASVVAVGLWLFRYPRPWFALPFLCCALSFIFLTQHPFPDPDNLVCPVPSATPQLQPLRFLDTFWRLVAHDATLLEYLTNRTLAATAMNFLVCAAIGLTLVRHVKTWARVALFGAALTLTIELTQLTGIWGYYACAYRQFNVDDLLLNMLGVLAGAALGRIKA